MDVEASHRRDLIASLGADFVCFEEVEIEHPLFVGLVLRADVVAVPVHDELWGHALAFEVKSFGIEAAYAKWSAATKQASDYVFGRILGAHETFIGSKGLRFLCLPSSSLFTLYPAH